MFCQGLLTYCRSQVTVWRQWRWTSVERITPGWGLKISVLCHSWTVEICSSEKSVSKLSVIFHVNFVAEEILVRMARKSNDEIITTISEAVGMLCQCHVRYLLELELNILHFRHRLGSP